MDRFIAKGMKQKNKNTTDLKSNMDRFIVKRVNEPTRSTCI